MRQLFYYKVRHRLLQIATGITKCDDYYKLGQYKLSIEKTTNVNIIGQTKTL